ncbi:AbrB/MazE/SpoVT family DNA-binding domain-containing protein [Bosea sp. CCNWLY174]|uniref:AbrB/MazE/SpoVT family DNA-binding domain-containing protein n=1 Tax=unclassified Bosea (in: a-proteobacteria) TaxID=2653178 RepID=UPI003FA60662
MNKPEKPAGEQAMVLQVRKIGNSVGIILPKELLARLKLAEGDKLTVVEQPEGAFKLTPRDDLHERTMAIARKAMKQYANALRELAK